MRIAALLLLLASPSTANTGRVVRIEKPRPTRVYIPSGTFSMGIAETEVEDLVAECEAAITTGPIFNTSAGAGALCDLYRDEVAHMKLREVYVDAFAIDRSEVSTGEYRACVAGGGCTLDALVAGDSRYIGTDTYPMVNATWDEARRFCSWRGGRLPTEAEWERAARADSAQRWPWGATARPNEFNHGKPRAGVLQKLDRQGVLALGVPDKDDGFELLAPVGSFPFGEGPYGTLDQAGNVAEWTADAWAFELDHALGYETREKGVWAPLSTVNPLREGGASERRVVRGGSWREPMFISRVNARDPFNLLYDPAGRFSHVGFRCAYRE